MLRSFVLVAVVATLTSPALAADPWQTRAEATDFVETASYEETLEQIRSLAESMPEIRLTEFGRSAEGRALPLVIVSSDRAFTPEAARKTGKAVILVQNGIHAGEIDGKDASLMILRDMARGKHRELLEQLILLIIPIYNVDGHERVSVFNRPNQDGPVAGMGFRTTADGHDLNRDHLKADTPEGRAVIGVFNAWRPHLHVDNHVTNGVEHAWVLTYSWAEAPQIAPSLDGWLATQMPRVLERTREAGHLVGPYVSLVDRNDPTKGINSYVGEPRYATGYYPLRHCPSILVENHSYKKYEDRVRANRDFMLALFAETAASAEALIDAVRKAEHRTIASGRMDADPSNVVLTWRPAEHEETVRIPIYEWQLEPSVALGTPILVYRTGKLAPIDVPWVHLAEADQTVSRPRGYLVLPGWPAIEQRLADHGLVVRRLTKPVELDVETIRIADAAPGPRATPSYQGRSPLSFTTRRATERRVLPRGTLWIPADQTDFEVAVQLLEPEAPDSLLGWGLISTVVERKEYIEPRVLEPLVREMLKDEATAAEWTEALEDPEFAAEPWARWIWWYRRTEFWDETVGLMPVMRLHQPVTLETSPWTR